MSFMGMKLFSHLIKLLHLMTLSSQQFCLCGILFNVHDTLIKHALRLALMRKKTHEIEHFISVESFGKRSGRATCSRWPILFCKAAAGPKGIHCAKARHQQYFNFPLYYYQTYTRHIYSLHFLSVIFGFF